ncbi:hypothetical protein MJ122_23905 [Pseudomonas sp. DP-17]|nr:hypothetical protein [Pseudomonas sp. DP-17]MCG8910292.1 hypothetical protein [Pseudomonas sp. DP-17]
MEIDQQEAQALLQLLELSDKEIQDGKFTDAMAFLDEMDDPDSNESLAGTAVGMSVPKA